MTYTMKYLLIYYVYELYNLVDNILYDKFCT